MQLKNSLIIIGCCFAQLLAASCTPPQAGARVWDIAAQALVNMRSINSEVDYLTASINNDFAGTFTVYDVILQKVSNAESDAQNINSLIDDVIADMPVILSKLSVTESSVSQLTSKVAGLGIDTSGVFEALDMMSKTICSKIETVITDLSGTELQIEAVTAQEIAYTHSIESKLGVLDTQVKALNSALDTIQFGSTMDGINNATNILVSLTDNLESDVVGLNGVVVNGFAGTFTALQTQNMSAMTLVLLSDIAQPTVTADFSGVYTALNQLDQTISTIGSKVDTINTSIVTDASLLAVINSSIDGTLSKISAVESKITPLPSLTDVVNSKLGWAVDTGLPLLSSEVDVATSKFGPIDSKTNDINSRIMDISGTVAAGTQKLFTVESQLEVINSKITHIDASDSKINAVNSKVDSQITQSFTIESAVDVIRREALTISSKIDNLQVLSLADVIDSKLGVIPSKFVTTNSELDVLIPSLQTTNSTLDLIIPMSANSISGLAVIESSLNSIDSKVSVTSITTLNSQLDVTNSQLSVIESKTVSLDNLLTTENTKADTLIADFSATWTILAAIDTKLSSAQTSLVRASSKLSTITIANDISATYTVIDSIVQKELTVSSKLDRTISLIDRYVAGFPDFSGTYTALNRLSNTASTIGSKVDVINSEVDVLVDYCGFPIYSKNLPKTISVPGRYFFAENLTYAPAVASTTTAITIATNDVTIDMNGCALRQTNANGTTKGIVVNTGLNNVRIMNGTVRDFTNIGIQTAGINSNIIIDGVYCTNSSSGIRIENSAGRGSSIIIRNCLCDLPRTVENINVRGVDNLVIDNCVCTNSRTHGIFFNDVTNILVKNCIICTNNTTGTGFGGIAFVNTTAFSKNGVFDSCTISNNTGNGIRFQPQIGSVVRNCICNGNAGGPQPGGISMVSYNAVSCIDNIIINNTCIGNTSAGISAVGLNASCANNYIAFNTCTENGINFMEAKTTGSTRNTYLGNFALNSTAVGDPNNTNYSLVDSVITSKVATVAQTGAFPAFTPTKWMNMNMLP